MPQKVMVTGCFDMLHSGHVAFLQEAAAFGDVYVCIGNDENILQLKERRQVQSAAERQFMLQALACVKECRVNGGMGILDFVAELDAIQPDVFFVNEEGHTLQKEDLCRSRGIRYIVSKRTPAAGLPPRSTSAIRLENRLPYRIDLAGGWLDQPWVSVHHKGAVLTISIEPDIEFNMRSGMATSTRKKAIELWGIDIPAGNLEQLAKLLFSFENPPGTKEVAGSQDALGIVMPGLNRYWYEGAYWPASITSVHDEAVLQWLESRLYLVSLGPREDSFSVLDDTRVTAAGAQRLSAAADACWAALLNMDAAAFGAAFTESFEAQCAMFPNMRNAGVYRVIDTCRSSCLGWKISGAGGGGYVIFFSETPVPGGIHIRIRRRPTLL